MDDVVAALAAQQDELVGFVEGLDDATLTRPSRCDGWSVADVLLHLAQTNEMAVASVEGRVAEWMDGVAKDMEPVGNVDDWAGALVAAERGEPSASLDRFLRSAPAQLAAFEACDPKARLTWVMGDLAARSLATTRLSETWIHTVDAVVGFAPEPPPTDRLWHIARLAWRTLPYAFQRAGAAAPGPVGFDLTAPDGSTWTFGMDEAPATVLTGTAHELCTVAAQRADAAATGLRATGPDAEDALRLVRTFA
jgi:uncharacterized protein (TIGR03084 family)